MKIKLLQGIKEKFVEALREIASIIFTIILLIMVIILRKVIK